MKFNNDEIGLIQFSLIASEQKDNSNKFFPRTFKLDEQVKAFEIMKKVLPALEKIAKEENQEDEIEFTTEEKAMLLKLLNREFSVIDIEHAISLREKLS